MPVVTLRAPLSELCGGRRHDLVAATVGEALVALEEAHPQVRGWVLDEQSRIREHVNVYVNGTPADERSEVGPTDLIHVLPAITGG